MVFASKKQLLIVVVLVLTLLSTAAAEETVVSNTTYTSGSSLDLEMGTYTVYVGAGNVTSMQLVGSVTNESYILSEGDCKRLGSERLCYEEKVDQSVRLAVFNLAAQVSVTLELNKTGKFIVGETLTATIWMNNTGETDAENVLLGMDLPVNISVDSIEECLRNHTHIYWKGTIRSDDAEHCVARLRVSGAVDETIKANITYNSFNILFEEETDEYAIEAEEPFTLTINVTSTTNLEPGQPFIISFEIINEDEEENLTLEPLEVTYDEGLSFLLTDIPRARTQDGRVYVNKKIENNTNFTGKFKIMPTRIGSEGEFKIGFTYNTTADGTIRTFYKTYTYSTIELPLIIGTQPKEITLEAFTKGNINVTVTNPYRYLTFNGYDADITFSLDNQKIRKRVPYQKSRIVAAVPYTAPDVTTHRRESIIVGVIAKTGEGDTVQAQQTFDVTITPLQTVSVEKVIQQQSVTNPALTVSVYATNEHQEPVIVSFEEQLPEGLFARGTTEITKTLQPGERLLIYSYDLLSTGDLPEEATTTTAYDYTYLGNYLEREETVAITPTTYTPPVVVKNDTEENLTVAEPEARVERQQPSLLHIVIGAAVLFIFVLIIIIWEWVRHIHTFRIKHKSLLKQYQALVDESKLLREKKESLRHEQHLMSKKLDIVEDHLKGYDEHLPEKIDDLEHRKQDVKKMESLIKERHENLKKRMDILKKKEDALIQYEHNFDNLVKKIENRENNLKQDDELLHQDIQSLTTDQAAITKQLDDNLKQQQLLKDRMKHFKARHAANLSSKINLLASRKKQVMDHHKQLEREEENIKNEFEKMQQDLELSQEDLERAEKLYKQATVQLKKGEHEEEQAAREEHTQ